MCADMYIGGFVKIQFDLQKLLYGGSLHLWFLPFIFIASIFGYALSCALNRIGLTGRFLRTLVGVAVVFVFYILLRHLSEESPFAQWKFGLVAVAFGWVFGCCRDLRVRYLVIYLCAFVPAVLVGFGLAGMPMLEMFAIMTGVAMVVASISIKTRPNMMSEFGKKYSLYIYLSHVLVWMIVYKISGFRGDVAVVIVFLFTLLSAVVVDRVLDNIPFRYQVAMRTWVGL